ncbi:helix-turn-helix transcriptional regulator [uncultured Treponema sp.]|uniref:helix-turn-helix domain-containing protein n=1 Tax=uncultured Treponema sp. TaxID=162155 RepID=UPI0025E6411E|nr:helix-turn-helix transcriptional regulator [uncultured Treponema sp.]
MEFWQRVKELLKSQKLTQDKLCKSCDISLATFVSWIHNERLPDLTSAIKIAEALNTSVEFLVSGNTPTFPKDESKEKAAALAQEIINLLK